MKNEIEKSSLNLFFLFHKKNIYFSDYFNVVILSPKESKFWTRVLFLAEIIL